MSRNIVFYGHHKCGSRYLRHSVLKQVAEQLGYIQHEYAKDQGVLVFDDLQDLDLKRAPFHVLRGNHVILNLLNAGPRVVEAVERIEPDHVGLHVVRDPRQVLVSGYFHHLEGHATQSQAWRWTRLEKVRAELKQRSLEDGLLYELETISGDVLQDQLAVWSERKNIIELRLEDVDAQLGALAQTLSDCLDAPALSLVASTHKRHANANSRGWESVFTERVKDAFKQRFSSLVTRWGYASNDNW